MKETMPLRIRPARESEWGQACVWLADADREGMRGVSASSLVLSLWDRRLDASGLWVAEAEDGLAGAILAQALSGGVGLVWPPGVRALPNRPQVEDHLLQVGCEWLRQRQVKLAQWLAQPMDSEGLASLRRQGFRRVTMLSEWERELSGGVREAGCSLPLVIDVAADAREFAQTLLATYEESRDCPESQGSRTTEELLADHGLSYSIVPTWGYVARWCGVPVGVLLLKKSEEEWASELSYVGVIPSHRGRGVGRQLVGWAIRDCGERGFRKLSLSVDVRNEPALQLYQSFGFHRIREWALYQLELKGNEKVF